MNEAWDDFLMEGRKKRRGALDGQAEAHASFKAGLHDDSDSVDLTLDIDEARELRDWLTKMIEEEEGRLKGKENGR